MNTFLNIISLIGLWWGFLSLAILCLYLPTLLKEPYFKRERIITASFITLSSFIGLNIYELLHEHIYSNIVSVRLGYFWVGFNLFLIILIYFKNKDRSDKNKD